MGAVAHDHPTLHLDQHQTVARGRGFQVGPAAGGPEVRPELVAGEAQEGWPGRVAHPRRPGIVRLRLLAQLEAAGADGHCPGVVAPASVRRGSEAARCRQKGHLRLDRTQRPLDARPIPRRVPREPGDRVDAVDEDVQVGVPTICVRDDHGLVLVKPKSLEQALGNGSHPRGRDGLRWSDGDEQVIRRPLDHPVALGRAFHLASRGLDAAAGEIVRRPPRGAAAAVVFRVLQVHRGVGEAESVRRAGDHGFTACSIRVRRVSTSVAGSGKRFRACRTT